MGSTNVSNAICSGSFIFSCIAAAAATGSFARITLDALRKLACSAEVAKGLPTPAAVNAVSNLRCKALGRLISPALATVSCSILVRNVSVCLTCAVSRCPCVVSTADSCLKISAALI